MEYFVAIVIALIILFIREQLKAYEKYGEMKQDHIDDLRETRVKLEKVIKQYDPNR